jgi:hypothetical protein
LLSEGDEGKLIKPVRVYSGFARFLSGITTERLKKILIPIKFLLKLVKPG